MVHNISAAQLGPMLVAHDKARIRRLRVAQLTVAVQGAAIIAAAAPVAFGDLKRSIGAEPTADGAKITIDAPHAAHVEYGTLPHFPPLGPLIRWCQLKGAENPFAMARAVQRKIGEQGTPPTWFVRRSIPKIELIAASLIFKSLIT